MEKAHDVVIVGAGAAGLTAGIFLGRHRPQARIRILDGAHRMGAKILVSGGGRCNVTNAQVNPEDFYGGNPHFLRRVLAAFSAEAARSFFHEIGVSLHEEEDGKLFPDSNSARTVLAALLGEAQRCGAQVLTGQRVIALVPVDDGFAIGVQTEKGEVSHRARYVVLATGGLSLPKTGSDGFGYSLARKLGHTLVPTTPALDSLLLDGDFHKPLSGVAHKVQLTAHIADKKPVRVSGFLLWTHFGASGPVSLNISRFWNRARLENLSVAITANFTGGAQFGKVEQALIEFAQEHPKTYVCTMLRSWLPARVAERVCAHLNMRTDQHAGQLTRDQRRKLVHALVEWPLPVLGTRGYRYAEVTAGGVPLSEINPATMESRVCPGLFLVGEILDADGRIGGFNFQWAWSSGYVAGLALASLIAGSR